MGRSRKASRDRGWTYLKRCCVRASTIPVLLLALGLSNAGAQTSSQRYCKYGDSLTLVLIDRTTQYDDLDRKIFVEGADTLYNSLKTGERVVLQTIQQGYANSEKLFDACL